MSEQGAKEALRAGVDRHRQGDLAGAEMLYRQVLAADPVNPDALHFLGVIAHQVGQHEESAALIGQAIARNPTDPSYHSNLALACRALGRTGDAVAALETAHGLAPGHVEIMVNLGSLHGLDGRIDTAMALFRRALDLEPDYAEAHFNLGTGLTRLGRHREAVPKSRRCLDLAPDHAEAHFNLAGSLLLQGDFAAGWAEYEWRWRRGGIVGDSALLAHPEWDGGALHGRTVLLHAEQGLGDTIQFTRYAPLVAARGGRVMVQCQAGLEGLIGGVDGVSEVCVRGDSPPAFDVQAPLLSLPRIFGTGGDSIPAQTPYLPVPDGAEIAMPGDGLKVGIVWAGSPGHENDRNRSCALAAFAPLLAVSGVSFYSLQVGERSADLEHAPGAIHDLAPRLTDFGATARAVAGLDLVVAVDTSVAHLAGALAKPVWVLLPFVPDWRWMLERGDSPWYPTMRLFRQQSPGDWKPVIEHLARELRALAAGPTDSGR